ncbi:hypothetical protein [Mycobacterium sp.]|jgi:hypothetical protein|uniref:hypothetical protein n=1 Tax=Mycobacterium sp. TaxID=1785 RepID=UPI0028B560BC|nr:hypothetical protein [Mycobacterium sp.]MDT5055157.1 hypothetical protein [Mycobacterium sp.]
MTVQTGQTGKQTGNLRRAVTGAVASSAMVVGLLMGIGSATANADVLDDVGAKYMEGAGGGQISNFVKEALTLRGLGFKPSKSNLDALQAGWDYLPNQSRLVDALKETLAHQRKMQALQQNAKNPAQPGSGLGMGPTQPPGVPPNPGDPNGGVSVGVPGNTINQPIG